MPLSKCRFCGKKVPNPYRPHHEQVCVVRRQREGSYVSPESKKQYVKARLNRAKQEEIERRNRPQKGLEVFGEAFSKGQKGSGFFQEGDSEMSDAKKGEAGK